MVAEVLEIGVTLVEVAEVEGLEEATASNVGSLVTGLASAQLVETAVEVVAVGIVMAVIGQGMDQLLFVRVTPKSLGSFFSF